MADFYSSTLGDMLLDESVLTGGYLDDLAKTSDVFEVSTLLSNAVKALSAGKQDNLTNQELLAIDASVDERQTAMKFGDSFDISSFDFTGYLSKDSFINIGLIDSISGWIKSPIDIQIGNAVTALQSELFKDCSALTSIIIPDSVSQIGFDAFVGCTNLKRISFSDKLDKIYKDTLSGCTSLESISIPNSVVEIGQYAFSQCSSLTSLYIPDELKTIADHAFISCFSLQSVVLGSGVSSVESDAFTDCSSLQQIIVRDKTQDEANALLNDTGIPETCEVVAYANFNWVSSTFQLSGNYLVPEDVTIDYHDNALWLSSQEYVTSVDCTDFIKDGMLSSAELCGTTLVLNFNTDAGSEPISVELSDFVDDYDDRIKYLSDCISSVLAEVSSNYLDKRIGGDISGSIRILSGNYVQTTTPLSVYNYSNSNGFIQAEATTKYGSASIGSRGFIVLGVTSAENKVTLSTNGSAISDIIPTSCYTSAWSIALDNYLDAQFSEISTVGADYVIFKKSFNQVANTNGKAQSYFIGLIKDDNALYCPTHPEIGNCVIPTFRSNHIEGGSTHATAQFAHAEGRSTFAEGRFSHAEGHGTLAAGTGAHAEGMGSKALENRGVHAEGWSTVSFGNYGSHSEGCETSALGTNGSHAEGYQTTASNLAAHAEGVATKATGSSSHAEGYKSEATNYGAHAEGGNYNGKIIGGKATGIASHAEGLQTTASAQTAHAEGEGTYATSQAAHSEGYQTSAVTAVAAHAEGAYTKASGNSSHAEGKWSYSIGTGAHAEGISCIADGSTYSAHAEGYGCYAKGKATHAEGYEVSAIGDYSHAAGYQSIANTGNSYANGVQVSAMNYRTIALGYNASTTQQGQFVWNGYTSEQKPYTPSNTIQGSFNINPKDGISGFYIGQDNFIQCVLSAMQSMNETQIIALKTALGI